MQEEVTYSTFDGLRPHFDALARVGYFKVVLKRLSFSKRRLHNAYRIFLGSFILMYNLQLLVRVILVRHSTHQVVDTLFLLLTTLTTLGKHVSFNVRSRRIDNIVNTINGPYFKPSNQYHVDVLKVNAHITARLLTLYHVAALSCAFLWAIYPLVNRALDVDVQFTGYIPFDTTGTTGFLVALTYMSVLIALQAYGNVSMDCTIASFYAQAQIQIKMLRYNLEHLATSNFNINEKPRSFKEIDYNFDKDDTVYQKRLKNCVLHYQEIIRFVEEVKSIFGEAMVFQFLVMAVVICTTMYKIVALSLSLEFFSMIVYLGCMLAQLFLYCYFGTQLQVESEFINQSIYCSDWLSLSPRFRRQLLIMMERCIQPIAPHIAYVIPMSLETYIVVLRASYTLFTILNR